MDSYILGYCVGKTSKTLELPSLAYLRATGVPFRQLVQQAEQYRTTEYKKHVDFLKTFDLEVGPVTFGMYNASLNTEKIINISKLAKGIVDKGLVEDEVHGIKFKPVRVSARYGKFSDAFHFTSEYGLRVYNTPPDEKLTSVEFVLKVTKDGRTLGASFTIFKTGRVRFSSGGVRADAKHLVKYISKNYFELSSDIPVRFNNITSEFKIGLPIKIEELFAIFDRAVTKGLAKFEDFEVETEYAPSRAVIIQKNSNKKKSPFLYVKFSGPKGKFTVTCSETGTIQLEGTIDGYDTASKFFKELKNVDLLKVNYTKTPSQNVTRTVLPNSRLARRSDMKPAPEITKRGTSCPIDRRPVPYSFQGKCPGGAGWYVRPNLQGQPCCYKIPKRIEYSIKKVAQRYAAANVKVPEDVRRIFGIGLNTNNKLNNVGRAAPVAVLARDPKSGFMIGSRQALRYSKVALVDIAKRMNIQVPRVISKAELAKKIEEAGTGGSRNVVKNAIQTKKKNLRITKKAIKDDLTRIGGRPATDKNVANFIQFLKNSNTGAPATKASVNAAKNAFIKRK